MANLSKLDETIDQLEIQAEMLKHNNKVLAKIAELSVSLEKGVSELTIGNKNFYATKNELQSSLKSLHDSVVSIQEQNEEHIDSLVAANKKFIREFSDDISSKLERFNSDIQVSIRQERTHLQEALKNNITSQFNSLESKQKELFTQQAKQISLLKILLIAVITLCLGLGIIVFVG